MADNKDILELLSEYLRRPDNHAGQLKRLADTQEKIADVIVTMRDEQIKGNQCLENVERGLEKLEYGLERLERTTNERFERVEKVLDKMANTLESIDRRLEKMSDLEQRIARLESIVLKAS